MASFEAKVYKLKIEEHPNADALELAVVGEYRSIVRKGQFKTGDLGVYIPEAAVCPDWLIEKLGLEGRLAGKQKNRVKAVKLRGVLSQGLIYPVDVVYPKNEQPPAGSNLPRVGHYAINVDGVFEIVSPGLDVTDSLGITKYEPPIPVHMAGEVFSAVGKTLHYDIENWKKYPHVLQDGEEVVMTEKVHGTWTCFAHHPEIEHSIITSKGLSAKGLAFKLNERNENNLYIRSLDNTITGGSGVLGHNMTVMDRLRGLLLRSNNPFGISWDTPVYLLGETFGKGVQDLTYTNEQRPLFRMFDVYVGHPGRGHFLDFPLFREICERLEVPTVPVLYVGPFSRERMFQYTDGKENVSGSSLHMREGIVIKPFVEREDLELGRVILKSVSDIYLDRKGGSEYE